MMQGVRDARDEAACVGIAGTATGHQLMKVRVDGIAATSPHSAFDNLVRLAISISPSPLPQRKHES